MAEYGADEFVLGQSAEDLLRRYESSVLDVYYQDLPFWIRDRENAAYLLLALHDSSVLPRILIGPIQHDVGHIQFLKSLEEGLVQAFRWVHRRGRPFGLQPTSNTEAADRTAEFVLHGMIYSTVADFHISYGRGLVHLSVNPKKQVVRFSYANPEDYASLVANWVEDAHTANRYPWMRRESIRFGKLGRRAAADVLTLAHRFEEGRIIIEDLAGVRSAGLWDLLEAGDRARVRDIEQSVDLGGFTTRELDHYWNALQAWSAYAMALYVRAALGGKDQSECLPTQIVPREQFLHTMGQVSELSVDAVGRITQRLSFGHKCSKADILLQPLVSEGARIGWSCAVVSENRYQRNMLKLMARMPHLKPLADNAIGERERTLLRELQRLLLPEGYQCKFSTPVTDGMEKGEVDLLAWTAHKPDEILLVEAKAFLVPDEVNEVDAITDEFIQGQTQLEKISRILETMELRQRARLFKFVPWERVRHAYGVVIAFEGLPNNRCDHSVWPCASLEVLRRRVGRRDRKHPNRIYKALRERSWLDEFRDTSSGWTSATIGDVTYELPTRTIPDDDA